MSCSKKDCIDCGDFIKKSDYNHKRCLKCKGFICYECCRRALDKEKRKNPEWKKYKDVNKNYTDDELDELEELADEFDNNIVCNGCEKRKMNLVRVKKNILKCKKNDK